MKKVLVTVLSLGLVFLPGVALAQDGDFLITSVEKGEPAPFTGILLTQESLSKIEAENALNLKICKNDCKLRLDEQRLLLERDISLLQSEIGGLNSIMLVKNKRIDELEEIIEDSNNSWTVPIIAVASFVLGVSITVGVTYAVNK